jgi:hypothetical protein
LHERASIPIPFSGVVAAFTASSLALKSHKRSLPGPDPPSRHVVPEHAVASMSGDDDVGSVRLSQRPLVVEYSPTASGSMPTLEVPTATHTSLLVQPMFDSGTEMLNAGVPCRDGAVVAATPQLARTNAATPSTAAKRDDSRTRVTTGLMNSLLRMSA